MLAPAAEEVEVLVDAFNGGEINFLEEAADKLAAIHGVQVPDLSETILGADVSCRAEVDLITATTGQAPAVLVASPDDLTLSSRRAGFE